MINLVIVISGECDDHDKSVMFATFDDNKANTWVKKFNRIIDNNKDRMQNYHSDGNYDKEEPYWYDYILWYKPMAIVNQVPLK